MEERNNQPALNVDGLIKVPVTLDASFFRRWLQFISPLHNISPRGMDILASFLSNRYELSKVITDKNLLEKVAVNSDSIKKVMNECGITSNYMQVMMGRFKRDGVIIDGKINPKFIPDLKEDSNSYKLLLYFYFN